ncbi:MAG TPA: NAD(P)H-dependent oxidoreductase, partial [Burkholderiales bacterium]|nr:NAD(P)H-dependent oxidoreductase [Burkholderiales bacterium]
MAQPSLKVLGVCGSLRKASFNMAALRACAELAPPGMSLSIADISDIPMYNQDVFDQGMPDSVKRFRAEVAAADGLLIASPEYNFS